MERKEKVYLTGSLSKQVNIYVAGKVFRVENTSIILVGSCLRKAVS